jgi:hypothetical protein
MKKKKAEGGGGGGLDGKKKGKIRGAFKQRQQEERGGAPAAPRHGRQLTISRSSGRGTTKKKAGPGVARAFDKP